MVTRESEMTRYLALAIALGAAAAAPVAAQDKEIEYPKGSLAYESLMAADYTLAEQQLRTDVRAHRNDPAKLINYGLALAKTGHLVEARRAFKQVLSEDEIELIMADGSTEASHEVARRGLKMIKSGQ